VTVTAAFTGQAVATNTAIPTLSEWGLAFAGPHHGCVRGRRIPPALLRSATKPTTSA
jgi:hypothetical protein